MPTQSPNKPSIKIPLRIVLIAPFIIQVVLLVGLVGYLSFRNGQRAVNNVAHQLQSEITARIEEHLLTFLDTPHQINQINANAIRQGLPDANDPHALERYFWEQIQVFDSVTSIYFGNTEGGLVDAGREGAKGSLYVIVTDEFTSGPFIKYATDSDGNRTGLLTTVPDFDARTRSWYINAVEKAGATWSDIYILFTGQDMAIAASRPVHDEQQNLLGVVSVDIFTSHIGDFMKNLKIGETGQGFIMERSGLLVASSADEAPFTGLGGDKVQRRLYASESTIPIIRYAAEFLTERWGDYHNVTTEQQFEFEIDGQRQFLNIAPVQDEYGIDWLIVVVIPESDFMAQINANNRATAFLVGAALMIAIVIGVITAQWVTGPILRLNASTQALARGEWDQTTGIEWIGEIGELSRSFDNMVGQLKQTLESLTSEIAERVRAEEKIKHLNNVLRAIRNVNQFITKEKDKDRLIARSCQLLVETRGYDSAWLVLFDANQKPVTAAQAGLGDEFSVLLERMENKVFNACSRQALEQTGVVAFEDPQSLCGDCPLLGQSPGFRALTIRLEHGGQIFGLLSVEIPAKLFLDDEEQELFREVANDIAFALHAIEMEKEQVRGEEALRESEARYRNIFQTAGVAIWEEDFSEIKAAIDDLKTQGVMDFRQYLNDHPEFVARAAQMIQVRDVNQAVLKMLGAQNKDELLGSLDKVFVPETLQIFREELIAIVEGQTYFEGETINQTLQGERRNVILTMAIPTQVEKLDSVLVSTIDITERKRAEQALRESEARLRLVLQNMPVMMNAFDAQEHITVWNQECERVTGYSADEIIGNPKAVQLLYPDEDSRTYIIEQLTRYGGKFRNLAWDIGCKDGGKKTILWSNMSEQFPIPGWYSWAIGLDITERVRAEQQIKQALAEKTTLLQELYHRTKNNMQVIYSMLALRSLYVQDEQLLTVLKDVQDRIHAMALVHQKLYESRDLSRIDLKEYIDDLAAYLVQSYQVQPDRISLDLQTDSVFVLIDTAIPCGLILSELISNALKHAFPGDRAGRISIRLHRAEDETIMLEVSDNGIGVPGDFCKSDSLGLQTVWGIVEHQLRGEISIATDHGVAWQIQFRDHLYSPRV